MNASRNTALCLPGGGVTGGLFQIGALSAFEAVFGEPSFGLFVGASSGAAVASGIAGGLPVQRLYRALIDPADNYFPLERHHLLNFDFGEWRRTIHSALSSVRHGLATLVARSPAPMPADLWEQMDRFYDALPAGLFSLDRYEHFLADFFLRRRVPNSFRSLSQRLLITAMDLDGGEPVVFGDPDLDHVPISLACAASLALPVFFSPVRIGERYYVDASTSAVTGVDVACEHDAKFVVVINPSVPVRTYDATGGVPTGHGIRNSLRDKGLMWVYNQSMRSAVHSAIVESVSRAERESNAYVLLIEPDPGEAMRFMHNAASLSARRDILQWAFRTTREKLRTWAVDNPKILQSAGWKLTNGAIADQASVPPVCGI
ncbi:MAG: patatin-like phospholipase family protein [Polyangiaceae bacterium]|jgi:predicted acylesterase/phospholipase RssA|nr:patatin-like phospholipase family protein [Polyangiaceae bacterium]